MENLLCSRISAIILSPATGSAESPRGLNKAFEDARSSEANCGLRKERQAQSQYVHAKALFDAGGGRVFLLGRRTPEQTARGSGKGIFGNCTVRTNDTTGPCQALETAMKDVTECEPEMGRREASA